MQAGLLFLPFSTLASFSSLFFNRVLAGSLPRFWIWHVSASFPSQHSIKEAKGECIKFPFKIFNEILMAYIITSCDQFFIIIVFLIIVTRMLRKEMKKQVLISNSYFKNSNFTQEFWDKHSELFLIPREKQSWKHSAHKAT